MWLRLVSRHCIKIFLLRYSLHEIWFILPVLRVVAYFTPKLFRLFWPRSVPFANHSKFFVQARHQTWSAIGFENFQIVAQGFLGCQFLEKYKIFHFGQFLMHQKKNSTIAEYVISRHIYWCTFRIYIVLHGCKVFVTS